MGCEKYYKVEVCHEKQKHFARKIKEKLILLSILAVLLLAIISIGVYGFSLLGKINRTKISNKDEDLGISKEVKDKIDSHKNAKDIVNIALFGLDQRDIKANGHSDSIMVLSIDKANKKLKVFSI